MGLSVYSSTTLDTKKGEFEKGCPLDTKKGEFGTPNFSIFNLTRKERKGNEENPVQVFVYIIYFCKKQHDRENHRTEQDRNSRICTD